MKDYSNEMFKRLTEIGRIALVMLMGVSSGIVLIVLAKAIMRWWLS